MKLTGSNRNTISDVAERLKELRARSGGERQESAGSVSYSEEFQTLFWEAADLHAQNKIELVLKARMLALLVGHEKDDLVDQLSASLCHDVLMIFQD